MTRYDDWGLILARAVHAIFAGPTNKQKEDFF